MSKFAENLRTLRKEKKLTQPELAKELNVSKAMISFWENGVCEPTASNIIAIANFFNVCIDDLLKSVL